VSSYWYVVVNVPQQVEITPSFIAEVKNKLGENLQDIGLLKANIPVPWLFLSNVRAVVLFLAAGLLSFGTLGVTLFMVNMALIGGVLGAASLIQFSPLLVFIAAVLPHGIFELPAVFLATAAVLKMGAVLVTPELDKSLGEVFLFALADWFRVFIGLVVPLLAIAAVVEVHVTPLIIKIAFPFL
jgi:uncharacterized membrane protein SpoIIM required for sporulation